MLKTNVEKECQSFRNLRKPRNLKLIHSSRESHLLKTKWNDPSTGIVGDCVDLRYSFGRIVVIRLHVTSVDHLSVMRRHLADQAYEEKGRERRE